MNQPAEQKARAKALFISDLHLQPSLPETTRVFLDFLENQGKEAEKLYILGDLFDSWAGDDDMDSAYLQMITAALKALSDSGTAVFWLCGNRDFLTGKKFLEATGALALPEVAVVDFGNTKIALVHGDAQCTDDQAYMQFRNMVRNPAWQQQFLAMPLPQRKALIAGMRHDSHKNNQEKSDQIMDVNAAAVTDVFARTGASILIHGHTHRPGRHIDTDGQEKRVRLVLSDWNMDSENPHGDWLELSADGEIVRHPL